MTEFVRIDGGKFLMGSDRHYPEEAPQHSAFAAPFELAATAVTNRDFAAFVAGTGYLTVAERAIDPNSFPGAEAVEPGSLVFTPTGGPLDLRRWQQWWRWVPGTSWAHPFGPDSDIAGKDDHPVVQIAYEDAHSYAEWAGARLPTEIEWEFAARGGLRGATYAWAKEPNDGTRANSWQGRFPYENLGARGWVYSAPIGAFPPNPFSLHEMTGNVWEWTSSRWTPRYSSNAVERADVAEASCCAPPSTRQTAASPSAGSPSTAPAQSSRVLKGGSHLCSPSYSLRYRPAARTPQTEDSATTHIGFRVARDL